MNPHQEANALEDLSAATRQLENIYLSLTRLEKQHQEWEENKKFQLNDLRDLVRRVERQLNFVLIALGGVVAWLWMHR